MQPAPGVLVTRHVELVRPLGKGGMGSVWVGRHTMLEIEVAVKFISPEHAAKDRFVARFRREASSAAKIKSPHVVQVFDHGVTDDGVPYIVMELLGGESLAARLRRERRVPARETAMLVSQVAKVLTTAHEMGIVHRDLKPDNLFLLESGYELFVKVLDFGIAKQLVGEELKEITDTGAMVGTPYYMSPEMLLSPKDADHRADLWALTVVAYHAIAGALPFRGETLAALSVAINDGNFKPPSAHVPDLGTELDVWFKLALCRNIEGRFQSAAELAQAFRQAVMVSGDISADRSEDTLSDRGLPRTARPRSDEGVASATASSSLASDDTEVAGSGAEPRPEPRPDPGPDSVVDATVTSEQLARIQRAAPAETTSPTLAAAGPTTLEGTTAAGAPARPRWPWAVGAAGLAAVIAIVVSSSQPASSPAPAAATSTASAERSSPPPPPSDPPPAGSAAGPVPSAPAPRSSGPAVTVTGVVKAPPIAPPVPSVSAGKPAYCAKTPFIVDAKGDLQPRLECF